MNEAIKPQTLPKADDLDIDLDIADLHIDEKKDAPKALPVRDDNNLDCATMSEPASRCCRAHSMTVPAT